MSDRLRIGLMYGAANESGGSSVTAMKDFAIWAERKKFSTLWMPQMFSWDAMTALTMVAGVTDRIELGTAVVPTFPRHPITMAQQALSVAEASGGRFTLGIGLSHKMIIEEMMGLSYERPAKHMREYLEVLLKLLRREPTRYEGDTYRVHAQVEVPGSQNVSVVVAALGERMLEEAGGLSSGTITWMTGLRTLAEHIIPRIRAAAERAHACEPRVIAGLPIAVTDDINAAKKVIDQTWAFYGKLPSYRAMLDREGVAAPSDIALLGNEAQLSARIAGIKGIGVTDLEASVTPVGQGSARRTLDFLASETELA